ncbi:MAG: tRNA uridine-5-carboxymethylaminomethyl(34) synthesis GTPase MnmE [Actinomycetia bacterium]|nr:tRNA uridine-5-carboxymethylaminomethyl(34) synthesis GTPase MnmE [Actinomycetes bacterium]
MAKAHAMEQPEVRTERGEGAAAPSPVAPVEHPEADLRPTRWAEDTIVAISTAIGTGAIGIVRMSGPDAIALAGRVFLPGRGTPIQADETYSLLYGHVVDPDNGDVVDEALLAVMRKPRSYTREDVVELHCHGGIAAQRAVLRLLTRMGVRLAEPGEFTRRAFLNGRIDLAQAESVAAIVAARSSGALRASVRQLDGGLSKALRTAREQLVGLLAQLEATVDFFDEDVDEVDRISLGQSLASVQSELLRLLRTAFLGRALEQGVSTAIVGRPNVGKSSLLNALLMRERAIVSHLPGTTRDTVEELMEIRGIPVHLVDTAGIRNDGGYVEQLGVARSVKAMEQADLVLAVIDLSAAWDDDDRRLILDLDPARSIIVGNKADLVEDEQGRVQALRDHILGGEVAGRGQRGNTVPTGAAPATQDLGAPQRRICVVSALTGSGLDELRSAIQQVVTGGEEFHLEEPVLASERQRVLVGEAAECTGTALQGVADGAGDELVCEDIRGAVEALGRITGEDLTADLLDEIFSKFCLGK